MSGLRLAIEADSSIKAKAMPAEKAASVLLEAIGQRAGWSPISCAILHNIRGADTAPSTGTIRAWYLSGQLCKAAVLCVPPVRWFADEMLGRCERRSLNFHATNPSLDRLVVERVRADWRDLHDSR